MKTKCLLLFILLSPVILLAQNTSSLSFDGVDDHVYIGTASVFNISDSITLEAWVKCDSIQTNNFARIIDKLDYANKKGFNIRLDYGSVLFQCFVSDGSGNNLRSTKKIQDNKWHHIAGTYDSRIMRLYIDGKLEKFGDVVGTFSINVNSQQPLAIAKSYDNSNANPFKGSMDEVRIWNKARDSSQIRKAKDSCLSGNERGLIGYWRFNENKDTVANDKSKYNNTGILKNGAAWSNNVGFKELCKTNGIISIAGKAVFLCPNPLIEESLLDLGQYQLPSIVLIYNAYGQLVFETTALSNVLLLKRTDFKSGIYFGSISNKTKTGYITQFKFIVQ